MTMLAGGHKKRECTIVILFALVEQSRRVPVAEIVLCEWKTAIREALKDRLGLAEKSNARDGV